MPRQARPVIVTGLRAWPAWALLTVGAVFALLLMGSGAGIALTLAPPQAASASKAAPMDHLVLTLTQGVTLSLVRVPAGVFVMGSLITDTEAVDDEWRQRKLYLDEFWIGRYEVTNAQYAAFARATGREWSAPAGEGDYPAVDVSWLDAVAFCQWASRVTGQPVHLPTEAQWEKAARGTDGREFPWGDEAPDGTRLNYDLLVKRTTPVGHYSPQGDSSYGAADMVGNVWEWTSSLYWPYPYRAHDGREGSGGDELLELRVLRGGSFMSERLLARSATRSDSFPTSRGVVIGFRVSMSPPEPEVPPAGA